VQNMVVSFKKFMQQIAGKKAPGPSTSFTIFHVFYALDLLSQNPQGRNKLAEKLNVGDGAVRTIIRRLVDAGLVETSKEGCNLTKKGLDIWGQFNEIFPKRIDSGQKVGSGIDQRDAAIIAGARKALVIVVRGGHLSIESVSDCIEQQYPKAANLLIEELKPQDNDVIIIAGADSLLKAKRGAFAASWSLIAA
jgi:predicted transcriptional regulator